MTSQRFAHVRGARTLKVAAAGSVLAATAAVGGINVAASAHTVSTQDETTYAAEQEPVTGTRQCIDDGSENLADQYESDPSVVGEHADNKGGSPTGLEHSQRWHAVVAHQGQPPSFAGNDSTDQTSTSGDDSTDQSGGSTEQSDEPSGDSGDEHSGDSGDEHSGDSQEQSDQGDQQQGDHYGDQGGDGGDQQGDGGGQHDD